MPKTLMLIHGRSFKPGRAILRNSWFEALGYGIERDFGAGARKKFSAAKHEFVYYGDLSNEFLRSRDKDYDRARDIADRKKCLTQLKQYSTENFLGDKGKRNYKALNGRAAVKEAVADVFSGPLRLFRLSDRIIKRVAPDMGHYWNPDSQFGSDVRWCLTVPLRRALSRGDDVMLISHSLGTLIAYDVLWKFSYYGEYQTLRDKGVPLSNLITLGSPLADAAASRNLKGARATGLRRFPTNVERWDNVAAEDDFISHDETVANDFSDMVDANLTQSITDRGIYNLAVRHGAANPHHGTGYLIHPTVSKLVHDWLQ